MAYEELLRALVGLACTALGFTAGRLSDPRVALASPGEGEERVPLDDPRRDPNWCHTHRQMYPCRGCKEPQK